MTEEIRKELSKCDLRIAYEKFIRKEYPEVAPGPMCDEKNEFYMRIGLFYHFTDTLFEHDTGESPIIPAIAPIPLI